MRGRRCRALAVFSFFTLASPVTAAVAQSDDPALLDEIGHGWSRVTCPEVKGGLLGPAVCFAPDDPGSGDFLTMSAMTVSTGVDPRVFVETTVSSFGGRRFDTPGLDIAEGAILNAGGQGVLTLVMVAGDRIYNMVLAWEGDPADAQAFLLDVARRQQRAAGRPGPSGSEQASGSELDRLLLTPAPGSGFEILATTDFPLEVEDLRPEARSQAVVDLLARIPSRVRILSADGVPAVVITLEEHPYPVFAATALAVFTEFPRERLVALDPATLPDAVGFRVPGAGGTAFGIALRKGPYLALLVTPPLGLDEDVAVAGLEQLAVLQADLLPDGDTAPYFFPSAGASIAVTVGLTTALCGGAFGLGRLAAARGRRRTRGGGHDRVAALGTDSVVDVTPRARALRRHGLALAIADLIAVNVVVAGALGLTGVLQMPVALAIVLVAGGSLAGILFTAWWARSELRRSGHDARAGELRPSVSGVIGGVVAMTLLVLGVAVLAAGLAGLAFGPSLSGLERSRRFGIDPFILDVAALVAGVVLLVLGGFAFRLARVWARTSAQRRRARDRRPPVLYLRSFEDDALRLPSVVSARRPFLELFAARGSDPFEESIAWQLAPYGPVIAIGRPGRSLQSLGAAREHLPDDVWRERVSDLMAAARGIVVTIGSTEGLRWEVEHLVSGGHLGRTIFVFPPAPAEAVRERWLFTTEALAGSGARVPDLPAPTEEVLGAVLDATGAWRAAVADIRDEATYRVALDRAMEWLVGRRSVVVVPEVRMVGTGPALPPPP